MIPALVTTQIVLAKSLPIPSIMAPFLGLTVDVTLRLKPGRGSPRTTGKDMLAQSKVSAMHYHYDTFLSILDRTRFLVSIPLVF